MIIEWPQLVQWSTSVDWSGRNLEYHRSKYNWSLLHQLLWIDAAVFTAINWWSNCCSQSTRRILAFNPTEAPEITTINEWSHSQICKIVYNTMNEDSLWIDFLSRFVVSYLNNIFKNDHRMATRGLTRPYIVCLCLRGELHLNHQFVIWCRPKCDKHGWVKLATFWVSCLCWLLVVVEL